MIKTIGKNKKFGSADKRLIHERSYNYFCKRKPASYVEGSFISNHFGFFIKVKMFLKNLIFYSPMLMLNSVYLISSLIPKKKNYGYSVLGLAKNIWTTRNISIKNY